MSTMTSRICSMIRGARLVEEQEAWSSHQGLPDRHHLLFAAGQVAGRAVPAIAQDREQLADVLVVGLQLIAARSPHQRPRPKVLLHGQFGEQAPPFHHLGDPVADDAGRRPLTDVEPVEADRPLGDPAAVSGQQPADRPQHRRLPGAVRAEQGDDRTGRDIEADPTEGDDHIAVDDLQVLDRQHRVVRLVHTPPLVRSTRFRGAGDGRVGRLDRTVRRVVVNRGLGPDGR